MAYNFRETLPAPRAKLGAAKMLHLRVAKAANGGHVVTHVMPESANQNYAFGAGQGAQVLQHIAKHMGIKAPAAPPAPEGDNALA